MTLRSYANLIVEPSPRACIDMSHLTDDEFAAFVGVSQLPSVLQGADWRHYAGDPLPCSWDGFCRVWWNVRYVWLQALEREADAAEL